MLIVGDVTGKGVQAAALTSLVRHTIRAASEYERSPAALLSIADRILKKQRATSICTALCMRIESTRAVLAVGGHPLPVQITEAGARPVGDHGPLLGGFASPRWTNHSLELAPGTALVAYTDGITDAIGADGERYGTTRLLDTLTHLRNRSAAGLIDGLTAALKNFQTGPPADDTAALVLRRARALHTGASDIENMTTRVREAIIR
jgi:sigma-B regulation protein RsbU (phosphoserine phosphatase)